MWYLVSGLFLLGVFAAAAGVLSDRRRRRAVERGETVCGDETAAIGECCGRHEVCVHDGLPAAAGRPVEYFDDEELDVYRGLPSDAYPEDTVDEFREVLYTLKAAEVTGWIRSLQLRDIHLPDTLKDEALLIAGERQL
jgi:hypothetical protein